jgi:pimeloyl-[acyl-carrier protein] methyl ester esterase
MDVVLLPGLDGTGELFRWFVEAAPAKFQCSVAAYPRDTVLSYPDYAALVIDRYVRDEPFLLVAESFSGPIAVIVAAQRPDRVAGLVLCNTFVARPGWTGLRYFPWGWHFRWSVPRFAAGFFLVGFRDVARFVGPIRQANDDVDPTVLASRMQLALAANVKRELVNLNVPVMYLRGTRDRLVGSRSVKQVLSIRPSTRIVQIPGPHLLLQVAPTESWRAISQFISDECAV